MDAPVIPIQEWLSAFREAADDVAASAMRFDEACASRKDSPHRPGAFIALLSDRNSVHVGLTASPDGCRALARGLLGLRTDQEIDEADVMDGVSEVMNIVAGKVKSRMSGRDGKLRLGLPMFLPNPASAGQGAESASADIKIGPVDCRLVVFRSARAA